MSPTFWGAALRFDRTPVADQLRAHYPAPTALTAPSCEVTVSVTVSGATLRWSAARLAEPPVLL